MNIDTGEFEQYLKDPQDPELKTLFSEIEVCIEKYDAKWGQIKKLNQQIQNLAFSIDLECAEWKYEIYTDG